MAWFEVKWVNKGVPLEEARCYGKHAVVKKIVEWIDSEFGEDGDQIHITEAKGRRK